MLPVRHNACERCFEHGYAILVPVIGPGLCQPLLVDILDPPKNNVPGLSYRKGLPHSRYDNSIPLPFQVFGKGQGLVFLTVYQSNPLHGKIRVL